MTVVGLLSYLRSLDIKIWADGDQLCLNAPKGVLTAALRAELAERKPEIIAFLRQADLTVRPTPPPMLPISRDGDLPLSFAQRRLWFIDQLVPGIPFYNLFLATRLIGPLNVTALEQSLNEVIRRHEALRTTFPTVDGRPVQVIAPCLPLTLLVVDLRESPEGKREAEAQRLATEEVRQPFDLARGPLVRAKLLWLDEEEHILLLTMHHIVSDGWSRVIFIQEMAVLYEAFSTGKPSPLPELPIQYADFAHWQREWLQGDVLEEQLAYWRQQLDGIPAVLELPTDRPRPAAQTFQGASHLFTLPITLSESLKELSHREGVTLFMTLLAAFKILLYRYTGQSDIVVGSPVANRNRPEIEGLIGFFVNMLVLRTDLSGNPTFRELLERVREVTLGAYAHQDLPFDELVEKLQPQRNLSHTPLFQVTFAIQEAPSSSLELPGLTMASLEVDSGTAMFDLSLYLVDTRQELIGLFEYPTDLFDAATISRMAGHFQTLLESVVANPEQRLAEMPLLTQAEHRQLLEEWNDTRTEYPKDKCVHELFEAQAERTPEAIAVSFGGEQLTYQELNCRANKLAHHLRMLGVGPEVLVGICMERSLEMVVGVLAILKAGGAYVPLDVTYPRDRLLFMLEDTQAPVMLTQERLLGELPEHRAKIVCIDRDWEVVAWQSEANPVNEAAAENVAYVMYTSGSTGVPKGISVPHLAINRLVTNTNYIELRPSDKVAQVSNSSFDAATFEIWGALLHGAKLIIISKDVALSPQEFALQIREQEISVLFLTTALFNQLVREVPSAFGSVHHLLFGGQAVDPKWVREVLENAPPKRLLHVYGPTENTTFTSWYLVEEVAEGATTIPIGGPIANTQIYVLDQHLRPAPVGVPGELCIGGDGLARDYYNRPGLTAEKFVPHPFPPSIPPIGREERGGARLYKTGDLVRYLPDGNIEFLGRSDYQVKMRGFRIELGEIEALLSQHPGVQEAVVLAREDTPGVKRLVAYVIPSRERRPTGGELRGFLKEKLPDYMVPSAFVSLDALPLTPNGKVDRRALPAPDRVRPELEESFIAPRTETEKILARIWAQVLGVEGVGVHDNFFESGGDSILGIQVIARANEAGLQLSPKHLFEYQTIAELATVAGTPQTIRAEQGLVAGPVPLTPIQRWFFEQDLAKPHHFNQALLLEVRQALDPGLLEKAVQHLLLHHDALRLRFELEEKLGWQQLNAGPDGPVPFSRVDLSLLPKAEQGPAIEAVAAELQASLNLSEGPLLRVALFELGLHKPDRLLLVIHHLAVDGVSWRILLEDLQTAYRQLSRGEAIQLPPKTTSFKQWAERLREYAHSAELREELAYWLAEPRRQVGPLPVDYPEGRGANTVASTRTVTVSLDDKETQALLQEVPRAYHTQINDVLLTALVQAFARWTGESSLLVDLEGHGREELFDGVDLSRTVGWFTTVFPLRLDLGGTAGVGEELKSVKEQLRNIPKRGIGYGLLRYLSGDQEVVEKLRGLPQAEMSFNYLGQLDQVLSEASLFGPAGESSGPARSPRGGRKHLLEINGGIAEGRLCLIWAYSENVHRRSTIEGWAREYVQALRSLIAHCVSPEAGGYTPSDFPQARVKQEDLDRFLAEIGQIGRGQY